MESSSISNSSSFNISALLDSITQSGGANDTGGTPEKPSSGNIPESATINPDNTNMGFFGNFKSKHLIIGIIIIVIFLADFSFSFTFLQIIPKYQNKLI